MSRLAWAVALLASGADAQSVKLRSHEIDALLSGNTASWEREGARYRQYFDPDGSTAYVIEGAMSDFGAWRVENDEFQSLWDGDSGWQGMFVMEYAGEFFWVSKAIPPTPFVIEEGHHLGSK